MSTIQKKIGRSSRSREFSRFVPEKIFLGLEGDPKVEIDVGNILEKEQARTVTYWIMEKRKKKDRVRG